MEPSSLNWKSQRLCNFVVPSETLVVAARCSRSNTTVKDESELFSFLKNGLTVVYSLVDVGSSIGGRLTFKLTITTFPVAFPGPNSFRSSFVHPVNASENKTMQTARKYVLSLFFILILYLLIIIFFILFLIWYLSDQ